MERDFDGLTRRSDEAQARKEFKDWTVETFEILF